MPIHPERELEFYALYDGGAPPHKDHCLTPLYKVDPLQCVTLCDNALDLMIALDRRVSEDSLDPGDALREEFLRIECLFQCTENDLFRTEQHPPLTRIEDAKRKHALFLAAMISLVDDYWSEAEDEDVQQVLYGPMRARTEFVLKECRSIHCLTQCGAN